MNHRQHAASLLAPEMQKLIDRMHKAARMPMQLMGPQQARNFYEAGAALLDMHPPKIAQVREIQLKARDGYWMPARLYSNQQADDAGSSADWPVLIYFHGGGFTIGSPNTHDVLCRHLARLADCTVISVAYRLAPEFRFPFAVNDAFDALLAVQQQARALGVDAQRIAVGGDSAGGTLATVCAHLARDAGIALRLQLLFYPGTTAWQDTDSHHRFSEGFLLDKATVSWFFDQYIDAADRDDWRFAPLNANDFSNLAPAWIGLAECDPLVDEGLAYADALRMAGVSVDIELYKGMVHGFINMGRTIAQAAIAHQDAARALRAGFRRNTG